jgi:hypothetical protein
MTKKIAILVRERKHEALRMAVGATLTDDEVNVFVMDDKLEPDDEMSLNLETLADIDVKVFSNNPDNQLEQKSTEEIARVLPEYDIIIPY